MAELQMRLKQYDKAEKTISQALEVESHNPIDLNAMLSQAKLLNLLAKVCTKVFIIIPLASCPNPQFTELGYGAWTVLSKRTPMERKIDELFGQFRMVTLYVSLFFQCQMMLFTTRKIPSPHDLHFQSIIVLYSLSTAV